MYRKELAYNMVSEAAGTMSDLATRLAVSLNLDGTLKSSLTPTFATLSVDGLTEIDGNLLVGGSLIELTGGINTQMLRVAQNSGLDRIGMYFHNNNAYLSTNQGTGGTSRNLYIGTVGLGPGVGPAAGVGSLAFIIGDVIQGFFNGSDGTTHFYKDFHIGEQPGGSDSYWYNQWTDGLNWERGKLTGDTGYIKITAQGMGSGSSNIDIILSPLGSGHVVIGTPNPTGGIFQIYDNTLTQFLDLFQDSNTANGASFNFNKRRNGNIVQNGDSLGSIRFRGYDGGEYRIGAQISAIMDSAPGTADIPASLVFSTTPDGYYVPLERMRIKNSGHIGFGTSSPDRLIHPEIADAITDAVSYPLRVTHICSTTSTGLSNGGGVGIEFELETSTDGTNQIASLFDTIWVDSTNISRKARSILTVYDTTARECLRAEASGTAAMIGFLGANASARLSHVADPSGGGVVDAEARSVINSILTTLETFGFHATS